MDYRKIPKISDTRKFAVITLKVEQGGFTEARVMHPKDTEGTPNSVDPDQTAPQAYLSKNLGSLQ